MKRRIRLTESDLHRIVKESVSRILNEVTFGGYNAAIDKARENARLKYRRIAANNFDTKEEQDEYVKNMMAAFEERINGTANLYNSYGGREKRNAPQYDFSLNQAIPNGPSIGQNYGSTISRDRYSVPKAGGVTFPGEGRYTVGVGDTQYLKGAKTYEPDGTPLNVPESEWGWHGFRGSGSGRNLVFNQKGKTVSTKGMSNQQIDALNNLRRGSDKVAHLGDAFSMGSAEEFSNK